MFSPRCKIACASSARSIGNTLQMEGFMEPSSILGQTFLTSSLRIYALNPGVRLRSMPPIRYLHALRIQRAKDILSSDYSSIGLVAESVGYGSVYHFSKMFKLYTGISPTAYARQTSH